MMVAQRLRNYFLTHPITVHTEFPIKQILFWPDLARWMTKWSIEFSEFYIPFKSRKAFKAQMLVDFIAKMTIPDKGKTEELMVFIDGSSNSKERGTCLLLKSNVEIVVEMSLKFSFLMSNNQVEYQAYLTYGRSTHQGKNRLLGQRPNVQKIIGFNQI